MKGNFHSEIQNIHLQENRDPSPNLHGPVTLAWKEPPDSQHRRERDGKVAGALGCGKSVPHGGRWTVAHLQEGRAAQVAQLLPMPQVC